MLNMNTSKTPVMKSKKRPTFSESRVDDYTTVGYGVVSERAHEMKQRKKRVTKPTRSSIGSGPSKSTILTATLCM